MTNLILHGASHGVQTLAASTTFETLTGVKQNIAHFHGPLQNGTTYPKFDVRTADTLWQQRQLYCQTWGSWDLATQKAWLTADLLGGKYDAVLDARAQEIAAWKHPLFIRLDGEMNGSWEAWYFTDPAEFVSRWRYIVQRFRSGGATNITWVWTPNQVSPAGSTTSTAADKLAPYYPGDDWVDWAGFDAYNFGNAHGYKTWVPWAGVITGSGFGYIGNTYDAVSKIAPSKPMFVAEFGCNDTLGDKVAWITDCLAIMPGYPQIRAITYFDWDADGANWTLKSSGTAAAWGQGLSKGPYAVTGLFVMPPDLQPIQPFTQTVVSGDPLAMLAALQGQVVAAKATLSSLQAQYVTLQQANAALQQSNATLQQTNSDLQQANATLQQANDALQQANVTLQQTNDALTAQNNTLTDQLAVAQKTISDTQAQLSAIQANLQALFRLANPPA